MSPREIQQIEDALPILVDEVLRAGTLTPKTRLALAVLTDAETAFAVERMIVAIAEQTVDTIAALTGLTLQPGVCRECGCTVDDCRHCIEKTGEPCSWVDAGRTLCSACVEGDE